LRLSGLVLIGLVLVWLSFEDHSPLGALTLAAGMCAWLALRYLQTPLPTSRQVWGRYALVGAVAGLAVAPLALLLMAVKTGLHAHPAPDYTAAQLQSAIDRILIFGISGLLIGLGSAAWRLARRTT
jgi:hypothetical protein